MTPYEYLARVRADLDGYYQFALRNAFEKPHINFEDITNIRLMIFVSCERVSNKGKLDNGNPSETKEAAQASTDQSHALRIYPRDE